MAALVGWVWWLVVGGGGGRWSVRGGVPTLERGNDQKLFKTSERMPGCREIVAHPNYIVIYQVRANQIRILRVLHARRQFPQP